MLSRKAHRVGHAARTEGGERALPGVCHLLSTCARRRRRSPPAATGSSGSSGPSSSGFTEQYNRAMSMAELYATERPPPIPLSEHQARSKRRDVADIIEAARRKGKSEAFVRERLTQLEALLPDVLNLHKLKASDWVTVLGDVDAVAATLVALKTVFPRADAFRVVQRTPKLLLKPTARVLQDAQQVRQLLASLPDPDAIIEAVPELVEPAALARALASIRAAMPSQQPMEVLQKSPEVLYSLGGEADMEDSAEYGEITTNL